MHEEENIEDSLYIIHFIPFFYIILIFYLGKIPYYIGGFIMKKATNLCFKEGIADYLVLSFIFWGTQRRTTVLI